LNKKNVALIQICGSHDECLYSQYRFLNEEGFDVHLIISENLISRIEHYDDNLNVLSLEFNNKLSNDIAKLYKIRKYLINNNIDSDIIHTASNEIISKLVYFIPQKIKIFGIIHSLKKLTTSFSQTLINIKIKNYFVINDYLHKYAPNLKNTKFSSFYPIYFKRSRIEIEKDGRDFWVAIPGSIEFIRRDYLGLIHNLEHREIPKNLKFLFLSNSKSKYSDAEKIKDLIKNKPYNDNFIFFDEFIMPEKLAAYLKKSDLILPLLNPGVANYKDYLNNQISGTFNLSFGFSVPMILHPDFIIIDDFKISSFFCGDNDFVDTILKFNNDREILQQKSSEIKSYKKFNFNLQQAKYLDFIRDKQTVD